MNTEKFSLLQQRRALAIGVVILSVFLVVMFATFREEITANMLGLILIQPISLLALIVSGLRSRFAIGHTYPLLQLIRANGIAVALSFFLPAKGGELLKPIVLRRVASVPISSGISMVLIERAIDALVVLSLVGLATYTGFELIASVSLQSLFLTISIVCLLIIGVLLLSWRARQFTLGVINTASKTLSQKKNILGLTSSTIVLWVMSLAMMIIFGLAADHNVLDIKALITIFVAATVGLSLGITPGGWGIVEGISVGLLLLYGLNLGEAISFAVMFRASVLLVPAVFALAGLREILNSEYRDTYE